MKNLRRLKLDTSDALERDALASWRDEGPSAASRERTWAVLASGVGIGASVAAKGTAAVGFAKVAAIGGSVTSATASAAPKAVTWLTASALKWIAVTAIASTAIATTAVVYRSPSSTEAPPVAASAPSAVANHTIVPGRAAHPPEPPSVPTALAPAEAPRGEVAVLPVARPSATSPTSAPPAADGRSLPTELALIESAHNALARGDTGQALRSLDAYDLRFPGGVLEQEASVLRVRALLLAGDRAGAAALAERFLAEHPASPYAGLVKKMLADPN
jgi:hypothetical protein